MYVHCVRQYDTVMIKYGYRIYREYSDTLTLNYTCTKIGLSPSTTCWRVYCQLSLLLETLNTLKTKIRPLDECQIV